MFHMPRYRVGLAVFAFMVFMPWHPPARAQCYPEEIDILFASDAAPDDNFGCSIAISSDFAFIGACGDDNGNGVDAGSVYVFERSGGTWVERPPKLTASDGASVDYFGGPVVVYGDTLMVGAPLDDNGVPGLTDAGSVYVFVRSGGAWIEQQKLTANDAENGDLFGMGIALEGDTAVIGAPEGFNPPSATGPGSAYVFTRSGGVWTQAAKLTASDPDLGDYFGLPPTLSGDTIFMGAHADDEYGVDAGAAYVFEKPVGGWTDMTETQKLIHSDPAPGDGFGFGSIDGGTALIGAWQHEHAGGHNDAGATYVFVRSGNQWVEQPPELTASDAQPEHLFGGALYRGAWALIGAPGDDDMALNAGAIYVFLHSLGVWSEEAKLTGSGCEDYSDFGRGGAAIVGNTALVGDPRDYSVVGANTGAVYVFRLNCNLPGDCDGDIDVDLDELEALAVCLKGPGIAHGLGCGCLDFEDDGDVDLEDFARFQHQFTGAQP